jgi:magnesium transporter
MARSKLFSIRRRSKPGAPPGTLISPLEASQPVLDCLAYSESAFVEKTGTDVATARKLRSEHPVTWVNLTGLADTSALVHVAGLFGLHQLALEDVLNVHQRPKVEEFDDHLFIVVRMIANAETGETEQVSIFLGKDYVLSVQERSGDCFDAVRERIRKGKGLIRGRGPDYLCYTLIDAVVDAYFPVLEHVGERIEALETEVIRRAEPGTIESVHDMKRTLLALRRTVWPHREMLNALVRAEHDLLRHDSQVYLRDCYDHTIQLMDILESYRETASALVDVYISSVSAKLNEIMKVLTIIATVFMPLGFIASLYGMNFDRTVSAWNMPELGWRFGYLFSLGLMAGCVGFLLYYFRRRGWMTRSRHSDRAVSRTGSPPDSR